MAKNNNRRKKKTQKTVFNLEKYIIEAARKLPFHKAYLDPDVIKQGLGGVIVSRKKPNGEIVFANFIVDIRCCGVKDIYYDLLDAMAFDEFVEESEQEMNTIFEEVDINHAANIVYASVEYADTLGLEPAAGYNIAEYLLPDVDDVIYEEIEVGLAGKPHYTYYPGDRVEKIFNALDESVGIDNYTADFREGDAYLFDDDNDDWEDDDWEDYDDEDLEDDEDIDDEETEGYTDYEEIKN
jgi:hypothetical protein